MCSSVKAFLVNLCIDCESRSAVLATLSFVSVHMPPDNDAFMVASNIDSCVLGKDVSWL